MINELIHTLFVHTWWRYDFQDASWFNQGYHYFNLLEGCIWCGFALLVLKRYLVHTNSSVEVWYAITFFSFAVSDFREAFAQSAWLVWLKLFLLVALFYLRKHVMSVYYPKASLY